MADLAKAREPGWYWVRDTAGKWEPAEFTNHPTMRWWFRCGWYESDKTLGCEVGPRILSPEHDARDAALRDVEAVLSCVPDSTPSTDELLRVLDKVREVLSCI